jgi:hypothetical protein
MAESKVEDHAMPPSDASTVQRSKRRHRKPQPAERVLKPSIPGFSSEEALELIGMCAVANNLGPVVFAPFPKGLHATDNPENPLPGDDGATYPFPLERIWPKGWAPGVASEDETRPWEKSILTSMLSNQTGVNGAIFAYNAERDAYAVAFAGTLNPGAAMEDLSALLIPAGPVQLNFFNSDETYLSPVPSVPVSPAGGTMDNPIPQPPEQTPLVHLGYRTAVESLAVGLVTPANLKSILSGIEKEEIDLYVTGHSLGASVAQLFAAWVKAGGVPAKKINVKCYSFATPKSANTPMAFNYALALGNHGFSYAVNNSLDTASQLPPTKETNADLFNPDISSDLQSKATPTGPYLASPLTPIVEMILKSSPSVPSVPSVPFPLSIFYEIVKAVTAPPAGSSSHASSGAASMDFAAMGVQHILAAEPPVVYTGECYPAEFFPSRSDEDLVSIPDETTRQWWQHWPFNYAHYLLNAAE